MKRSLGAIHAALAAVLLSGPVGPARADDSAAKDLVDKAIKALGGEEKLAKVEAATWKAKATISFNGNDSDFTSESTVKGFDRYRSEFEGEFNGNPFKGVVVLDGDKGWRKFGENRSEMDEAAVANEKRTIYLQVVPTLLVPLKGKDFQIEAAGEETVAGSPAAGVKVKGPDRKDFTLYFDKASGLPVKLVAPGVVGFQGEEFTQETTFGDYKDFDGIKKATKVASTRDGEKFVSQVITDFKVLDKDKVAPETFGEPQ